MKRRNLLLSLLLIAFAPAMTFAGLDVGDEISGFSANDDKGELWNLENHLGQKNIVVFFYPAAMTGGCTKQACAYRDSSAALNDVDAIVVGVSGDSVNNLKYFREANGLNFPLLSDPSGTIAELFGVPTRGGSSIEREVDGLMKTLTRGITTSRWTFVIGKDGKIIYKNDAVKAPLDSETVIAELKKL